MLSRTPLNVTAAAVTTLMVSGLQAAERTPLFPLPFTPDFTDGAGWGYALGLGLEYEAAYTGSDEYEFELDLAGAIQYRSGNHLFSWEGLELSWTTRVHEQWYVQIDLGLDGERESDDSEKGHLNGLDERDEVLITTADVRYAFNPEWRQYIGARISYGLDDYGMLGFFFVGYRFGDRNDGGGTEVFVYATVADSNNLNWDFGVTEAEASRSGLAATNLDFGHRSTGVRIVDRRFASEHVQIVSGVQFEYLSSEVQQSPIAREDFTAELEFGVLYQF